MIPVNACVDLPKDTDYDFLDIFGAIVTLPTAVYNQRTEVYDQSIDPDTEYACTWYSARHCVNEGNAIEAENARVDIFGQDNPKNEWKTAIKRGAVANKGWSLQGAVKMAMDLGYISGYTKCADVLALKLAIYKRNLIQTGSNKIDWRGT
jgi:hypothetical protein